MSNINRISHSLNKSARTFVSALGRSDALAPIILLEATVVTGRTYHAHKRGGFIEARERGTEEVLGSIFWLGGVQAFNKLGDVIGRKVLGQKDVDFEVGKDAVRNPMKNYMKKFPKYGEKALATFKFAKIASSILLANAVIGFVVPKLNQAITRKYQGSVEKLEEQNPNLRKNAESFDSFISKTSAKNKKNTSFKGNAAQTLLALSDGFENDARYKLLSTDVGIAGGRAINARNKQERREILFRDLSSIYFYMFCRSNLNSALNLMESGRSTRLDPTSAKSLDNHLQENLDRNRAYSAAEFESAVLGNRNAEIPSKVQEKIKGGIINLDEFKKIVGGNSPIAKSGEFMSKLQPEVDGKAILSAEQVKDVYSGGLINDPKFLNNIFEKYTNKKSTNPMSFVSEKDLRKLKQQMVDYADDIIKMTKKSGESITFNTLKKASRSNFIKNTLNHGSGFAMSVYFLSTAIPKIQYWMTRKQTGSNNFPGTEKYKK